MAKARTAKPKRRKATPRPVRLPHIQSVSLTEEHAAGIEVACRFLGHSRSQYIREAIAERLVRHGVLAAPVQPAPIVVG